MTHTLMIYNIDNTYTSMWRRFINHATVDYNDEYEQYGPFERYIRLVLKEYNAVIISNKFSGVFVEFPNDEQYMAFAMRWT